VPQKPNDASLITISQVQLGSLIMAKVSHLHMRDVKGFGSAFDTKNMGKQFI